MHSISVWNFASSPNYEKNVDMIYPYSEVPYIGNYKLVRIPIASSSTIIPSSDIIDHVDYWGEGRIDTTQGSSGFPYCYNVNHQYQLVSNGPDTDKKIPNRVPVISYTDCDTSSYIKDNSVKLVTLMGAPINKSCARDMARMVNTDLGKVVVYGFSSEARDIKNLEEELYKKKLYFCDGYTLPDLLKTITLFEERDYRSYLNITDLSTELYQKIDDGDFKNAINICKIMEDSGNTASIVDVITRTLKEGKRNIMTFAYKLWNSDSPNMVSNYFPISFKLIFNQDYVKIISKKNMFTVRFDTNENTNEIKYAIGDGKDKESPKLRWKIIAVLEGDILYFKILNGDHEMFLKMEDNEPVKEVKGSITAHDAKTQWFLDPIKVDDDMLFFIVNREYNQGLKLDENSNENGTKRLLGHHGSVYNEALTYGWYIAPW